MLLIRRSNLMLQCSGSAYNPVFTVFCVIYKLSVCNLVFCVISNGSFYTQMKANSLRGYSLLAFYTQLEVIKSRNLEATAGLSGGIF